MNQILSTPTPAQLRQMATTSADPVIRQALLDLAREKEGRAPPAR